MRTRDPLILHPGRSLKRFVFFTVGNHKVHTTQNMTLAEAVTFAEEICAKARVFRHVEIMDYNWKTLATGHGQQMFQRAQSDGVQRQ